ncbi:MAG: FG-GAP-like repeat-containing protein, partial [Gemmatimonadota bacterium]|nr:FG-GAP-like repeat-containing protein [Gemmatimonadota bacterium]
MSAKSSAGNPASFAGFGSLVSRILLWIILPLLAAGGSALAQNQTPVIQYPVPNFSMFEYQEMRIIISAYDPDGDSIYYVMDSSQAPTGAVLTDSIITWTPNFAQVGLNTIIYSVKDVPAGATVTDTFTVTVLDDEGLDSYSEVAAVVGLDDAGMANALAWADFNNDSITDVFVANAGEPGTLYKGDASGNFTVASEFSASGGDAGSAAWADYDHDGRIDLYVVHSGLFGGRVNRLYHNDATGTFTDTTAVSGTGDQGLGKSVTWVDFDTDGDPDLYVVNHGGANVLYSNNGNGTFTSMADSAGGVIFDAGDGVAAAWCDYNLDNKPDCYLVNEHGPNYLFENDGDSTFTDVTDAAGVGHTGSGSAAAWGDFDNDGDFDLFLGNKDSLQVLFSNNGDGTTFTRLGSTGLSVSGGARSAQWVDSDMDGWLDLLVTFSDSTIKLFKNLGDSTFVNSAPVTGIDAPGYWTAATWADPTDLGVPDLYLARRDGANHYYSCGQRGNYLKVRLHGVVSSRFGLGARVILYSGSTVLNRWIDGGTGSMNEPAALFGLGLLNTVDSLSVFWPCGLQRDTTAVTVNQTITLWETDSLFPVIDSTTIYPDTNWLGPDTIYTWIDDADSLTVELRYSTDRGQTYVPVSMTPGGNNKYQGIIPGQVSGTRVCYYIRALDAAGHLSFDPYWAEDTVYSFSVDDSVPAVDSVTVLDDTSDETGPFQVAARVSDDDSIRAVYLVWSISVSGQLIEVDSAQMAITGSDSVSIDFAGDLAGRAIGTQINYYVRAVDLAGNYTHVPATAPDSTYSFRVSHFSERDFASSYLEYKGFGISVADFNGDGYADVFAANHDTTDFLFAGSTDSFFTNVSPATVGTAIRTTRGGVWGDYDNDRDPDLFLFGPGTNVLYSNNGNGTLTDVTASLGLGDEGDGWWGAAWVDYDNDGLLDLFLVNKDGEDMLYHNEDTSFVDRAAPAGLSGTQDAVGCCWADYDSDGDQDLYMVYYGSQNRLYRNNGNSTFTEVTGTAQVAGSENSVSAAWFDYDNDSHLDLYVIEQPGDLLYRSNGNGTFSLVDMQAVGLGEAYGGFGMGWGDFDNDGYPDLYKTRGEAGQPEINVMYRGGSGGTFTDYTFETGTNDAGEYRGGAWLDYDRDGRLDLVINNHSGRLRLYRNIDPWTDNHYLRIRLVGTRSNADGIGARVTVAAGGKTWRQDMGTGTGYLGQSEPVLHFGLGSASSVDSVTVRWPGGIV